MFKRSKRKPNLPPNVPFADMKRAELASDIRDLLANQEPAAGLMTIVAVRALRIFIKVAKERAEKGEQSNAEHSYNEMATIEFWIRQSYANYTSDEYDELERLRPYWFYIGAGVIKVSAGITDEDPAREVIVDIWRYLVLGLPYVKGALTNNQVWQDFEKDEFLKFGEDQYPQFGIDLLLRLCECPRTVTNHPKFERAREEALLRLNEVG